MNTDLQSRIDEILEKLQYGGNPQDSWWKEANEALLKLFQEWAEGCVPDEVEVEEPEYAPPDDPLVAADQAFNECRTQTLNRIKNIGGKK